MSENREITQKGYLYLGISLGIALIASAIIFTNGLVKIRSASDVIFVKGYADKNVVSDLAIWQPKVQVWSPNLAEAYSKLKADADKFYNFLLSRGIKKDEITLKSIENIITYEKQGYEDNKARKTGYQLIQNFYIESKDVALITKVSQEVGEVLSQGVELISETPDYYYTKLESEKIELLGKAIENARQRADAMAKVTGGKIKGLKSSSQGIFQVTEKYSMDVSDYGIFDTKSLEKTIKCVVSAEFYQK